MADFPSVANPLVLPRWLVDRARELAELEGLVYGPQTWGARNVLDGLAAGTIVVLREYPGRSGVTRGGMAWRG